MQSAIIHIVKNGIGASANDEITSYDTRLNADPIFF